jgi:hypothetical protein
MAELEQYKRDNVDAPDDEEAPHVSCPVEGYWYKDSTLGECNAINIMIRSHT